jgi:hypothetical protein
MTMATYFLATNLAALDARGLAAAGALGPAAIARPAFATATGGCNAAIGSCYATAAEAGKQEVGSFGFSVARGNDQAGYQQHGKQRVQFHIVHSLLN